MEQRSQTVNGVELAWLESGDGPPCLMLHGLGGDGAPSFVPVMEHVTGRKCFAPWARGHGPSGRPSSYLIEDYGADAAAFIEDVIGEPVPVIGFSLGTLAAAWVAINRPELVTGLFLEDSPLMVLHDPERHPNETYQQLFPAMSAIARRVQHDGHDAQWAAQEVAKLQLTAPTLDGTFGDVMPPAAIAFMASQIMHNDPAVTEPATTRPTAELVATLNPDDLAGISCPTHLLVGNWDLGGSCPPQDLERWLELIPHAKHRTFHDTGHGIRIAPHTLPGYLEELDQFLAAP